MNSDAHSSTTAGAHYDTITIYGVGLLGGSLAAAIKQRNLARQVIGCGRRAIRLQAAQASGLIDSCQTDLIESVRKADLVIICTPVPQIVPLILALAPAAKPGTLITDVGSVKQTICSDLSDQLPNDVFFVGSHPMAGSEQSGFEYADADLFDGKVTVVTPTEETDALCLAKIEQFWRLIGSTVVTMTPQQHDRAVADTSHLPHIAAAVLVAGLNKEVEAVAATGFRDTTRIASGNPELWTGILLQNREEILRSISGFERRLVDFRNCLQNQDEAGLKKWLQIAKTKRDTLYGQNHEHS